MASSPALELPPAPSRALAGRLIGGWGAFAAWLLFCVAALWLFRHEIAALSFRDPDDALRLQQVRDWIAGQSLFDVTQYRINPPFGGPMHWSRIVDLPIAALIELARPLMGMERAEIFACAATPLLLLGATLWATYILTKRLGGAGLALMAGLLLLTSPSILVQFTPLRIDHHGWQILLGAIALAGLFDDRPLRGGLIVGMALAVWLQISTEALPYTALFAGLLGLRFLLSPGEARRFAAFASTLGSSALLLLVMTRGWQAPLAQYCDSLSAAYIWPLIAFGGTSVLAWRLIGTASYSRRFAVLAVGAGAALLTFAFAGGPCLSGDPFKALGPFAYKYWYLQIREGRPIWEQDLVTRGVIILPPLIGLIGAWLAVQKAAPRSDQRFAWCLLAMVIIGTTAVSCMVMRALSFAHVAALPATAFLFLHLLKRAQASPKAVVRVLGSSALILLSPAGLCATWVAATSKNGGIGNGALASCQTAEALRPLASLPRSVVFAPIDLGPDILVKTHHSVIATGHHRNAVGITAVIKGFTSNPRAAHKLIRELRGGRGADYVVSCNSMNGFLYYSEISPHGLGAMLEKGRHPDWLKPVPATGTLHIYKVLP
ncbi:hypothetical protein [Sphingobium bisphenolivorans]|uniref:hypothetical protein n=1 Tax=Sphingobium bisphenolivorans TaxID=1335760 RepID=UPI00039E666E|nr:hypothetical protein [Sphingobium bisphenolivorans]